MKKAANLKVGDAFRPAHPRQMSMNGKKMSPMVQYIVTKKFSQSPYFLICTERHSKKGLYSLSPEAPVISPKEPRPSIQGVEAFLGVKPRKRSTGYRLLWDGERDIEDWLAPRAKAILRIMLSYGRRDYPAKELHDIINKEFLRFYGKPCTSPPIVAFYMVKRQLVNHGFIEEIVETDNNDPRLVEIGIEDD